MHPTLKISGQRLKYMPYIKAINTIFIEVIKAINPIFIEVLEVTVRQSSSQFQNPRAFSLPSLRTLLTTLVYRLKTYKLWIKVFTGTHFPVLDRCLFHIRK